VKDLPPESHCRCTVLAMTSGHWAARGIAFPSGHPQRRDVAMQRQDYVFAIHSVLFAYLVLAAAILATLRLHGQAQEHAHQAGDVCRGFVVLPTGIAVLSGMPVSHAPGGTHTPHAAAHAGGAMPSAMEHSHMQPMGGQA